MIFCIQSLFDCVIGCWVNYEHITFEGSNRNQWALNWIPLNCSYRTIKCHCFCHFKQSFIILNEWPREFVLSNVLVYRFPSSEHAAIEVLPQFKSKIVWALIYILVKNLFFLMSTIFRCPETVPMHKTSFKEGLQLSALICPSFSLLLPLSSMTYVTDISIKLQTRTVLS